MNNQFSSTAKYLTGELFSSGIFFPMNRNSKESTLSRVEYITQKSMGKTIVHMGCCDHIPLIDDKIKNNQWLHKRLTECATECIGIDIDKESLEYIKKLGYTNVVYGDIFNDELLEVTTKKWDLIILGEILEHTDNPVAFLSALHTRYKGNIREILITVPNGFSIENFKGVFKNIEYINSDHRYWFSPYTLGKILTLSGFSPTEFTFMQYGKSVRTGFGIRAFLYQWLFKNKPASRESLIMIGKF